MKYSDKILQHLRERFQVRLNVRLPVGFKWRKFRGMIEFKRDTTVTELFYGSK